jgi:hypothetical protein
VARDEGAQASDRRKPAPVAVAIDAGFRQALVLLAAILAAASRPVTRHLPNCGQAR